MPPITIEGQLNPAERRLLAEAIRNVSPKPQVVIEVGTWLGGGSTLHILRALELNGTGHLWGIEADRSIYEAMLVNIRRAAPEAAHRFTPLFGFSQRVIPEWLAQQGEGIRVDLAFLDGGNNPREQMEEFHLLDPHIPVGGQLLAHDAKLRKGAWLVPYLSRLDNWQVTLHDISVEGLLHARKIAEQPSARSLQAAERALCRARWHPREIVAAICPAWLKRWGLRVMPRRLARRITDGRK